jgi:hypothetical protein
MMRELRFVIAKPEVFWGGSGYTTILVGKTIF